MSIKVNGLSVYYDNLKAVDEISFDVSEGEIFGFLGPNGAGKTSTIKVLTTLLPPTSGQVSVMGYDVVLNGMEVRKRVGVVQQKVVYEVFLTVEKALDLYGLLWGIPKAERRNKIDELLESFGLVEKKKTPLTDLSIGLQRRVQVAQEFLHDPKVLFLDEPTVGLDPLSRRYTLDLIKNKAKEGMTIFYTTHVLEEVDYICDRAAVIDKGRIAVVGSPRDLKQKYGGLKTIEITLGDSSEKAVSSFLSELTHYSEQHNNVLDIKHERTLNLITLQTKENPGNLLNEIILLSSNNRVKISSLIMKEPSLEDTFIKIIKENGD
ncbi:ATP-binding cassette domain-containing protein [Candidatus Bathyarchaeota archaeon]|nr:ATP-binding cassette domain-containing protein [Candidatus Bathyarchaeota archaeon]